MSIHVALTHETRYRYGQPASLGPQVIRLRPAPHSRSRILSYALKVERPGIPQLATGPPRQLPRPDRRARKNAGVPAAGRPRRRDSGLQSVSTSSSNPKPRVTRSPTSRASPRNSSPTRARAGGSVARAVDRDGGTRPLADRGFPVELNRRLHQDVAYVIRMEPGVQTCEETLSLRSGSCRDSAWLLVQILRRLGSPRASFPDTSSS